MSFFDCSAGGQYLYAVKKAVAIFVALCLLVQCAAHLGLAGFYTLNQSYVARVFCVNKDKPKMKCNGKCHLRKQMKQAEDNGSSSDSNTAKVEKSEASPCLLPTPLRFQTPLPSGLSFAVQHPVSQHLFGRDLSRSVFRPPSC